MKKLLLVLLLILGSFCTTEAQTTTQVDWTTENAKNWGSFKWAVSRNTYPDANGKYWYYVYTYSNSLYNKKTDGYNYDKAITFVKDVNIYMYEYNYVGGVENHYNTVTTHLTHFTCDYVMGGYIESFWSYSQYNNFRITFRKASAYDKSIY